MTIQQLHYFLALCEDLNYTHAAGRLYLSRQALRLSIAALEEELCGPLFTNRRNRLALTAKGERFRAQAAPVVEQFDAMCAQAYQDIQAPPLRLGISVALVPDYLPPLGDALEAFRQRYPGIPLEVSSLANDEVPAQLQSGALDAGLVMDLGSCAAVLARTALTKHTAALLVSRRSRFWPRQAVSPAELDGETLLVPGFDPDALRPLWQAFLDADAHPKLEIGEKFYQVLYQTQEQNCLALNRFESSSTRETDNVKDVVLEGMPPICSAFLCPAQARHPCADLLCSFLKDALKAV